MRLIKDSDIEYYKLKDALLAELRKHGDSQTDDIPIENIESNTMADKEAEYHKKLMEDK